ncbi:MAG: glutathione S-transferase family protein, partial [Halocynthiibacter sp.]
MITLEMYKPAFDEPSASPFCVKAICLLQASGQKWTPRYLSDPRKAPKQKYPVLVDGEDIVPDSDQIRTHLETRYHVDFDDGLSDRDRAISRAVIRMTEENIYFGLMADRWKEDENWVYIRDLFFSEIPSFMRGVITSRIRKGAVDALNSHGLGRFTRAERFARVRQDIDAITGILGDNAFLFGGKPTAADMSVGPMLRAISKSPVL